MPDRSDDELLADYVQNRSSDALGELVRRHVAFVYAAALRQVGDRSMAEDIAQAVFLVFVKKAASIRASSLSGWLFNTARYCAANARRAGARRKHHESQAMRPEVQMPAEDATTMQQMLPLLDDALSTLGRSDREVVLLRYLQGREFADVGTILGISEPTARKRLNRAIEKLRQYFSARGPAIDVVALSDGLTALPRIAPDHLASSVVAVAAGKTVASAAVANISTRAIHMMIWAKAKIAAIIVGGTIVFGATGATIVMNAKAQSTDAKPAQAAPPAAVAVSPAPSAFSAKFSDGMTVELIGIAENPSQGKPWWRPDGSLLAKPPYEKVAASVNPQQGDGAFELAAKISNRPTLPIGYIWRNTGSWAIGGVTPIDPSTRDIIAVAVGLPAHPTANLRLWIAAGPWQTRATTRPDGGGLLASSGHQTAVFAPPVEADKGCKVTVSDPSGDVVTRLMAVDVDGRERFPMQWGSSTNGGIRDTTATFRGLSVKEVKEFQFQTRPYDRWVEFRNVSLIAGKIANVTVVASEQAPTTRP